MIKDLSCSIHVKKNIVNELNTNKVSGTYILYGNDKNRLFEIALAFGKSLNCEVLKNDFCGQCESCIRMEKGTHGDLELVVGENGIKIESIRNLIYRASTSAYEGKNKIFILKDIENMRIPASNALLKTLEESQKGNFFFLLTTSLNILSTIKSRSTIIKISEMKREELGVSLEEYEFFNRKAMEILEYKKQNFNIESPVDYFNIGKFMKVYFIDKNLENKINIYKSLRYFVNNLKWSSKIDILYFIDEIVMNLSEKNFLNEILEYVASLNSPNLNLENILKAKNRLRIPINIKALLIKIFIKKNI